MKPAAAFQYSLMQVGRRLPASIVLLATLWAAPALANPCNNSIPNCQPQVQAAISYSGWETKGWAYYCGGDHLNVWSFGSNNTCFSVAENRSAEGDNHAKFDATITNWCFKKESLVITLACSDKVRPHGDVGAP